MSSHYYRLLNVFALEGQPLSGNPLCVFEDARGLDEVTMQALALQFNLSETTFILPSETATARVRIFTPSFEMAFAGHPTLGTAEVVRSLYNTGDALTLEMRAGVIPVTAHDTQWTLQANKPTWREVEASTEQLATMLGLQPQDIASQPLWVSVGSEQLILPLSSAEAVQRCVPNAELLRRYAGNSQQNFPVYVWSPATTESITARFFFAKGSAVIEDPATGSACANLGGWFVATQASLPLNRHVHQGAAVARPSLLGLHVNTAQQIFVSGRVLELGRGFIEL